LHPEDVDRAGRTEPDHVRETDLRAVYLTRARRAAEVRRDLEDARHAGRAERMPLREEAPGDVHGDAPAVGRLAVVDEAAGLAVRAEPQVLVVQDLRSREAVVQLDQVEVVGADAGALPRLPRGVARQRVDVGEGQVA